MAQADAGGVRSQGTRPERHVYEIRDGSRPDDSQFHEFESLPSELPRLDNFGADISMSSTWIVRFLQ